jgi:hypothetical protein
LAAATGCVNVRGPASMSCPASLPQPQTKMINARARLAPSPRTISFIDASEKQLM